MFEAIHGSAPDIAGKNIANPSGLLQAACMMLVHIGLGNFAEVIQNAWLKTIEDGIHTADIYREGISKHKVSTTEFTNAVIEKIKNKEKPQVLKPIQYKKDAKINTIIVNRKISKKELVGVDVYLDYKGNPIELGENLTSLIKNLSHLKLRVITNRGVRVYPEGVIDTFCTDHWRCRFVSKDTYELEGEPFFPVIPKEEILKLLSLLYEAGYDVIKTENLYYIDDKRAFSLAQGE